MQSVIPWQTGTTLSQMLSAGDMNRGRPGHPTEPGVSSRETRTECLRMAGLGAATPQGAHTPGLLFTWSV